MRNDVENKHDLRDAQGPKMCLEACVWTTQGSIDRMLKSKGRVEKEKKGLLDKSVAIMGKVSVW